MLFRQMTPSGILHNPLNMPDGWEKDNPDVAYYLEWQKFFEKIMFYNSFLLICIPIICFSFGLWKFAGEEEITESAMQRAIESSQQIGMLDGDDAEKSSSRSENPKKKKKKRK
jgi:hypothetical protein